MIFYREGFTYDMTAGDYDCNVTLVTDVDRSGFFNEYIARLAR